MPPRRGTVTDAGRNERLTELVEAARQRVRRGVYTQASLDRLAGAGIDIADLFGGGQATGRLPAQDAPPATGGQPAAAKGGAGRMERVGPEDVQPDLQGRQLAQFIRAVQRVQAAPEGAEVGARTLDRLRAGAFAGGYDPATPGEFGPQGLDAAQARQLDLTQLLDRYRREFRPRVRSQSPVYEL